MKINIAVLFFAIIVSITACDKREDFYSGVNAAPKIEFRKKGTEAFSNTLVDSVKKMFPNYSFEVRVTDEENLTLNYSCYYKSDKLTISNNTGTFTPDTAIVFAHDLAFVVKDSYEKYCFATAIITLFDNLPPVALFTPIKISIHDPLEYNIDASSSYDRDAKYGGTIVEYEFTINTSYVVNTSFNHLYYIFPSPGNYSVSVRVKDNNGEWSGPKGTILTVS